MNALSLSPEVIPLDEEQVRDWADADVRLRVPDDDTIPTRLRGRVVTPHEYHDCCVKLAGLWGGAVEKYFETPHSKSLRQTLFLQRATQYKTALIALQMATEHAPDFDAPDPDFYVN